VVDGVPGAGRGAAGFEPRHRIHHLQRGADHEIVGPLDTAAQHHRVDAGRAQPRGGAGRGGVRERRPPEIAHGVGQRREECPALVAVGLRRRRAGERERNGLVRGRLPQCRIREQTDDSGDRHDDSRDDGAAGRAIQVIGFGHDGNSKRPSPWAAAGGRAP